MASTENELDLRAGDWVIVRSKEEILATLGSDGRLEGLPFHPEMFAFCGRRLRVFKVAHKTCDTVSKTGGRRMLRTVHLEDSRCDGSQHGGCQADCMLFWKEAWLKRADVTATARPATHATAGVSEADVVRAARAGTDEKTGEAIWRCQATTLLESTQPLPWWDLRQYVRDVTSGNHTAGHMAKILLAASYRRIIGFGHGYRLLVGFYNRVARAFGGQTYIAINGTVPKSTPTPVENLNLQPGEWVQIRPVSEIETTLHQGSNYNRGMLFDKEQVYSCGKRYRVKARIDRIIDERSGKMIPMKTPCIELEGVYCKALCSEKRLGCPRSIPSYWREIWLRRA